MPSATDFDQGGTARQWVRTYMGPSVGWVYLPGRNPISINAVGTYTLQPDTSVVNVFVNGAVILILPSANDPSVPAGVQPALFAKTAISIVDIGGFAQANPITIRPKTGSGETIMGLAQVQITSNYGAFILSPNASTGRWINSVQ